MDDDKTELLEHRLRETLRTSVEADLKRKYSWFGIIGIVLTSGILVSLFNIVLNDSRVNLEVAKALEQHFRKSYIEAEKKISDARDRIEKRDKEFSESVAENDRKLKQLVLQAEKLEKKLKKSSSAQLSLITLLRKQFAALTEVIVKNLGPGEFEKETGFIEDMLMELEMMEMDMDDEILNITNE